MRLTWALYKYATVVWLRLLLGYLAVGAGAFCSTINNNPEMEIGVQPEGQKIKTASHWLLPLPQSKMAILPPGISE